MWKNGHTNLSLSYFILEFCSYLGQRKLVKSFVTMSASRLFMPLLRSSNKRNFSTSKKRSSGDHHDDGGIPGAVRNSDDLPYFKLSDVLLCRIYLSISTIATSLLYSSPPSLPADSACLFWWFVISFWKKLRELECWRTSLAESDLAVLFDSN